ncbi:signal peptidase 22 kDa subunit [Serendipita vermifera]|nr:signal peptidase 22 kDa subunit [Serendipita vermifera]
MYSSLQRLNNLSTFVTTCLLALLAAVSMSSFLLATNPSGAVGVSPVQIALRQTSPWSPKKEEAAFFEFSIDADLRSLFHWNTKQLFLYLTAEYTNRNGLENEVVIWDRIVRRKQDARIKIENGKNKYYFKEYSGSFRNVSDAQFVLKYNVMPWVGPLTWGEGGRTVSKVQFPSKK